MKYQCPFCESFDVRRNDLGEVFCFSCFSVCSDPNIDELLWGRVSELPPPFPEELERRNTRRSMKALRSASASQIIRRIV